jgi:predicted flap endonuclease-1-like 5' DNA nuclease
MGRWLLRLLIAGLVAAAVAFALARMLGQDEEDFDDFDDFDTDFEFETPVEIDGPAEEGTSTATMASAGEGGISGVSARVAGASAATAPLRSLDSIEGGTDMTAQTAAGEAGSLIDINGIGPAYEARLQAIGINTMADLANADSNHIAEQIDPIGGVNTVEDWISQARAYVEGRWSEGNQG